MDTIKLKRLLKYLDISFVVILSLVIAVTTSNFVFKYIPDAPSSEKRVLRTFPRPLDKDLKALIKYAAVLPSGIDAYFNDRFSLRNHTIQNYSELKLFAFNESPSDQVIKGKDGWFYFNFENFNDYYFCKSAVDDTYLENIYQDLQLNDQKVKQFGADYIILVSPNKETIYPEFLPDQYRNKFCPETRLLSLDKYLQNKELNFINPTFDIINAKAKNISYFKTDSHWNQHAAKTSFELLEKKFMKIKPGFLSSNQIDFVTESKYPVIGDLSNFMSVQKLKENHVANIDYYPKNNLKIDLEEYTADYKPSGKIYDYRELNLTIANNNILNFKAFNPKAKNNLKVVLFRDSFAWAMLPFFLNDFKEVYFLSPANPFQIDLQVIAEFQPDFVVQQFVERKLMTN